MKDYDGPVYQKRQSSSERRFVRQHPPHREGQHFKTALEARHEQERGYRPVYHHEQPWRAMPRAVDTEIQEVTVGSEEGYTVPFLQHQERNRFNTEVVAQRMAMPEVKEEESVSYDGELRLPQRPKRERFVENTDVEQPWAPVRKIKGVSEQVTTRNVNVTQEESVEPTLIKQDVHQLAQQAETQRFQPTRLPKPYDPETGYTTVEAQESAEIIHVNKAKDDYLLFDI